MMISLSLKPHAYRRLIASHPFTRLNQKRRSLFSGTKVSLNAQTAVFTWGVGTNGQLGHKFEPSNEKLLGIFEDSSYVQADPRRLVKSKTFKKVACGSEFMIALNDAGQVFGWGKVWGLGNGAQKITFQPVMIPSDVPFIDIAAGANHCAAIDGEGQLYTWGMGKSGGMFSFSKSNGACLGHGTTDSIDKPKLVEEVKSYGVKIKSVSCGILHTNALTVDGEVLVFGCGEFGLLGNGSPTDQFRPISIDSLVDTDIVQVAAGENHNLALSSTGELFTWGKNDAGQLGLGDSFMDQFSMEDQPRRMDNLDGKKVTYICAGLNRSAAITNTGELYVWGSGLHHEPLLVKSTFGGHRASKVCIGGSSGRSCIAVLAENGTLWTFGDKGSKMLARKLDFATSKYPDPIEVNFKGKKVLDIAAGLGQHMAAVVVNSDE